MQDLQRENKTTSKQEQPQYQLLTGNAGLMLDKIPNESVDVCFTSPEPPMNHYEMMSLVADMMTVNQVMKPSGSIWVELADYHNTEGDMTLIPERFLHWMVIENGWHLRSKLIWHRTDHYIKEAIPTDNTRFKRDYEYLFWFVKNNPGYYINKDCLLYNMYTNSSIIEAECRDVPEGEFGTNFPGKLVVMAMDLTLPDKGVALDPYSGTATTGIAVVNRGCKYIGIDRDEQLQYKADLRLKTCLMTPAEKSRVMLGIS